MKVAKYWHRLENLDHFEILKECFHVCKKNNHKWYRDITELLECNGMGYLSKNPKSYCQSVLSQLENVLKDQYRQKYQEKLNSNSELSTLCILKKNSYKQSAYLNSIDNIETRKKFTALRTGCSKLKAHQHHSKGLNKSQIFDLQLCQFCNKDIENTSHILLMCQENGIVNIRNEILNKINIVYPNFKSLKLEHKLCCILNLKTLDRNVDMVKFSNLCTSLVDSILNYK